jgi:hypothetical protein
MKTHIIIHVLPYEIDRFESEILELHKNSKYLSKEDEVVIDATLNLNDIIIDWSKSKMDKQYFVDRFENTKKACQWATLYYDISSNNECLGVDDKRRIAIKKYASSCNNFIYLDCDVWFPNTTLKYMIDAAKLIKNKYYILSPQIPMLWDASWDILCNESYKLHWRNKLTDIDHFDVFTKDYGQIEIVQMPILKMGGGWFNMISSNLLEYIGVPDAFGPYGLDDTFLIDACEIMKSMKIDVQQYLMHNLVVTQNFSYDTRMVYSSYLSFNINQVSIFNNNAKKSYQQEIQKFAERCKTDRIQGKI